MKKHRLLYTLLVFAVAMCGLLVLSCGDGDKKANKRPEGPETGIYYYESDGVEYLITLNGGDSVTVLTEEQGKTGTYSVSGNTLSFKFGNEKLSATLAEDILTLDYNGTPVRFTKKITYTVKFDSNGGSSVASVPVVNGKTIVAPSDPVRDDFEFIGWYKDSDKFDSPFIFGSDIVTENITLYARWVKPVFGQSEFTVSFDLGYETDQVIDSQKTVGGKLYDLVTPTREGYVFRDWWVSMYDDSEKLSYKVTADTVFNENTTVYALWQSVDNSGRLAAPIVDVSSSGISWGSNANAQTYHVEVTYIEESGVTATEKFDNINTDTGSTSVNINFAGAPAGDYIIAVNAVSGSGASSDATVRYYRNKALARVSLFTVVEPSTLVYNGVEGAEKYLLSIDCGDSNHKHTSYDNGLSTSFNFANCLMKEGGIKFTVTAVATGRASSTSAVYTYNDRVLEAVSGIRYDSATEEVSWNGVANALGYVVDLSCEHDEHDHNVQIEVGNKTSISLKTFDPCNGKITVSVKPVTKGYISPKATEIDIEKTTLAAPNGITIKNDVLSWDPVASAASYEISIGGTNYTSNTNSFNLTEGAVNTTWTQAADYQIRIMAKSENNESLWSDAVDARYYAMYSTITYNGGEVSWRHVIGVDKYNVRVNDGEAIVINNGVNRTAVRLTQAGENTIYVNFVDDEGTTSDWYSVTVFAHTIDFDLRGGSVAESESVASQYYAIGDKLYLPTDIEKTGYDFAGWYTTPLGGDGLGALYNDSYFNNAGGFVLYAYWTPKVYTVTFDGNGGTVDVESKGVTYLSDDYVWPVAVSTDSSMIFAGWFSDKNGLEIQYTDEKGKALRPWTITRDMTVYACWNSIFSFEKLLNGTYRVKKNASLFSLAPANLTIPATYQGVDDARPINVTEIGSTSFTNSSMLITVNIPNSIRYVDTAAFNGSNNITAFTVYDVEGVRAPEYSAHDGVLYHSTLNDFGAVTEMEMVIFPRAKTGEYAMPSGVTLMPLNILNSAKITKLTIPATVTVIERHAIYSCSSLTEIEFEYAGNVTEDGKVAALNIYDEAIASCSKLKTVKFPARLNEFKPTIFLSCSAFEKIEMETASKDYSSVSGFLCDANKTTILYCPPAAISDSFTLPVGITTIGERAFAGNTKIKEVIFPLWSSEIKTAGFSGCTYIERIVFNGVAVNDFVIGERAFERCTRLKYIVFDEGSKVTEFGKYAFTGCTALESIDFPETLVKIDEYAFEKCTKLDNLVFPSKLGIIGQYAFTGCTKLANITFAEDGVNVTLDDFAFNGCTSILSVDIPSNVTQIGDGVFAGCTKLATIEVDPANTKYETWQGVLFTKGFEEMLFYPLGRTGNFELPEQVKSLSAALFKGNTSLESITIGKNVVSIGAEAFMNCTGLLTVIFEGGDGVDIELKEKIFEGCTNLVEVQLTNRIKVIPDRLFYNDKAISIINMPEYVTSIGENAFYSCSSITSLTIPATVSEIGYSAFKYCSGLISVTFDNAPDNADTPASEDDDADNAIVYAQSLTFVENDQHLSEAFYGCTSLTTVNIPKRLTRIANSLFYNCSALGTIEIPNTVSYIGSKAFASCSSLTTVGFEGGNLSNKLEICEAVDGTNASSSTGAFTGCSMLSSINLPARIDYIPAYTFYNCKALVSIIIPNSVKNIYKSDSEEIKIYAVQKDAFYNCTNLETVTFADGNVNPVTIGPEAFRYCSSLKSLRLPKNLTYEVKKDKEGNDISDYYDVFATDAFVNCAQFEMIDVENGGKYYSNDGILYYRDTIENEDGTQTSINELVYCPKSRKKAVTVPYSVLSINAKAFFKCWDVKSFSFQETPDGEEEVDLKINDAKDANSGAFNQFIGITSLELPNRLTYIGDYGFYNCSMLRELSIDTVNSKLKHVGKYAFAKCTGLSNIVVPSRTEKLDNNAFDGCTRITSFTFEQGSQLKTIGNNVFAETAFNTITIPDTVTTIGSGIFKDSNVATVYLPSSLSEMNPNIFIGCDTIESIYLENNAKYYVEDSVVYNAAKTELLLYPVGKTDESFSILEGVKTINTEAFSGNSYLKTVTIPNTVTEIMEGAFYGCSALTTVNFTEDDEDTRITRLNVGSTTDKKGVFQNCAELKSVNLPERTVLLGTNSFSGCGSLDQLTIHVDAALQVINANVFSNAGGGTLVLPKAVSTIKSNAFSGSLFTQIVMSNVSVIEDNAFNNSSITSVTLPSTLTTIGVSAFAGSQELRTVEVRLNQTSNLVINTTTTNTVSAANGSKGTFANCPKLTTVTIATNGTLPYFMFYNCTGLTSLTITGNASIDGYLCHNLSNLKKVNIAKSVRKIGQYAFYGCSNLGSHVAENCVDEDCSGQSEHGFEFTGTMNDSLAEIGNYSFYGTAISSFVVPNTVETFGTYVFTNNKALSSVTLPTKSFTSIGDQAFNGCSNLSNVIFVDKGTQQERKFVTVGVNAFGGCTSLTSFDFTGFTTINSSAFLGSGLTTVTIPSTVRTLGSQAFQDCASIATATIPTDAFATLNSKLFMNCVALHTVRFVGTGSNVLTTISDSAFAGCTSLKNISFHTGLTTINDNAFLDSGLTRITLSSTITDIKPLAFAGCNIASVTVPNDNANFSLSSDNTALLSKDGTVFIRYIGSAEEYTIPSGVTTIDSYAFSDSTVKKVILATTVKYINDNAFINCASLETVEFKEGLESIGSYAFAACTSLGDIALPDSLTLLGAYAFSESGITSVTIGPNLEEIGNYVFNLCANLNNVVIPGNIKSIGNYAFFQNTGLSSVTLNSGLETIGTQAFAGCETLNNVTLPNTLTKISNGAFMDCIALSGITIPTSVTMIEKAAFAGCSTLSSVTLVEGTEKLTILPGSSSAAANRGAFAFTAIQNVDFSKRHIYNSATATDQALPNYIFDNCVDLISCTLSNDITSIGTCAFQNCSQLSVFTVPTSVTVINTEAFRNSGLSRITLPDGLLTIGTYAFMDCKLLERITIPGTVKTINSAAFAGCLLLESVIFEEDNGVGIGFANGSVALSFNPAGSVKSRGVFGGCVSLKSVDLSTRSIIYNHATLTSATYKNYLANYIFSDCTALTSVVLPDDVISIGTASFYNSGLTSFTVGAKVDRIYNAAFAECTSLQTFTIMRSNTKLGIASGSSLTSVSSFGVFYNCSALTEIDLTGRSAIYSSATSTTATSKYLGGYTFYGCSALADVKIPNDLTQIGTFAFYGCAMLKSFTVPSAVTTIGISAFRNSGLTGIAIPDKVTTIGVSAFRDCCDLVTVSFSDSLQYVNNFAFMDCVSLNSIRIPSSTQRIGYAAFAGCESLQLIEFEDHASPLAFAKGWGTEGEERGVFGDCTSLRTIDLSNINVRRTYSSSLTSSSWSYTINSAMPEYMFYNCTALESVVLSEVMWFGGGYSGNRSYEDYVFANCVNLKNVTFPREVEFRLGDTSFENCGFESLTLPNNLAGYGCDVFANNKKLTNLTFEPGAICTYIRGFSGCEMLSSVTLPDKLTGIYINAFKDCVMLKSIELPESLEFIDSNAFMNTGLINVTVPSGIRMYSYVFAECKDLLTVTFGESISNFGWHIFENCSALTTVTLPQSGLNTISPYTFYGCESLVTLVIPETVTSISEFAFAGCTSLAQIVISENIEEIGDYAFEGWTADQTIYVETHASAPEGWSEYWNWNSKQVDVTPEPSEPEEGEEPVIPDPVYETRPDKPCDAVIVWSYVAP